MCYGFLRVFPFPSRTRLVDTRATPALEGEVAPVDFECHQILKITAGFQHLFPNLHNLQRPNANLRREGNLRNPSNIRCKKKKPWFPEKYVKSFPGNLLYFAGK